MRFTYYQVFTQRPEDEDTKLPRKIWTFLEKITVYYFYVSTNSRPFEGGPRENRK